MDFELLCFINKTEKTFGLLELIFGCLLIYDKFPNIKIEKKHLYDTIESMIAILHRLDI